MDGIATQAGMARMAAAVGGTFPSPLHYWNLDTTAFADSAGIFDLASSDGTVTIDTTGGPDGGPAADLNPVGEELIRIGGEYWDGVQSNITVSIWAKIDALSSTGNWLFSWRGNTTSPNDRFCQILVNNAGVARWFVLDASNNVGTADSTSTISTGAWYHFVGTHDGNNAKIYVNGHHEATSSTPSFGAYPNQLMPLALGAASWATTSNSLNHDGMLAKCGVWDVALTASEVSTLYNNGNGLNYADL